MSAMVCFHCGEVVPRGVDLTVLRGAQREPVCCHGCQAVAEAILAGGFDAYYERRSAPAMCAVPGTDASNMGRSGTDRTTDRTTDYDDLEVQRSFVRALPDGSREAMLMLEGIRCAACVWLNEQAVRRVAGVLTFDVNQMTEQAVLRWDPTRVQLSAVLRAVASIGYRAWPFDAQKHEALAKEQWQQMVRRLFVAVMGMMQVMMFALPGYITGPGDIEPQWLRLLQWASLILTVPVLGYSAAPMFAGAWRDVRNWRVGMDVPVVLGLAAAFIASAWHTLLNDGHVVWYDSITMFVFLLLSARALEYRARQRATQGITDLLRVVPAMVSRVRNVRDAQAERVPVTSVKIGELLEVQPGEVLALDAELISDSAEVGLALLTGESTPVVRRHGDALPAGALNMAAPIVVRVSRLAGDDTVSAIERLMARASGQRPHIAALADRVARIFLAALLLLSIVAGVAWAFIDADRALPIVVALLVVSCPCALSLATPAALAASTGALARDGVLVTRGRAIEGLAQLTDVVFDKTGTLTEAAPKLDGIETHADINEGTCLAIAAAIERGSAHPLARAIERACFARRNDGGVPRVEAATDVIVQPGLGLEATVEGTRYRIGSWRHVTDWLALAANEAPRVSPAEAMTSNVPQARVYLGDSEGVLACFIMATPLRQGAAESMATMRAMGLRIHLLSGDVMQSAQRAAAALGIEHAEGGLAPEEKLERVRAMQASGCVVAMVGDGINDAPVLAGADVAIAMGDGSALAQVSADVVLMSDQIARLPAAMTRARRTMRVVHQNLLWAGLYNGIAIPAAAFGFVTPWIASVGMSISSLVVVLNALRLSRR